MSKRDIGLEKLCERCLLEVIYYICPGSNTQIPLECQEEDPCGQRCSYFGRYRQWVLLSLSEPIKFDSDSGFRIGEDQDDCPDGTFRSFILDFAVTVELPG